MPKLKTTYLFFLFSLVLLLGCVSKKDFNYINKNVDAYLKEKENAIDVLEYSFEKQRIVLIACSNHSTINDILFLNSENLKKLYDKGLRYILCEGGLQNKLVYEKEDLEKKYVKVFYPWEKVGAVFSPSSLHHEVLKINSTIPENDQIKLVGLEGGREVFLVEKNSEHDILNYRDKYMFDVAQSFIDSKDEKIKFLILCGSLHGSKKILKENRKKIYPLAYHLHNKYKDDFETFEYISLSDIFIDSMHYKEFLESETWQKNDYRQKFLNKHDIIKLNRFIPILVGKENKSYKNFFVDKNSAYGIKYGYALKEEYVLTEIVNQTKITSLKLQNKTIDINKLSTEDFYEIEAFVKNIYYLKLFYAEKFNYNFWNPNTLLISALDELPSSYFSNDALTYKQLTEYQNLLSVMNYLQFSNSIKNSTLYYNYGKELIEKARKLIPQEVWFDYWHALMNFKIGDYHASLDYCKKLLDNQLILCSQIFPEILNLAIENSENLNLDYSFYDNKLRNLRNEFNIDVSRERNP